MLLKTYNTTCKDNSEITIKVLKAPLEEYRDSVLECTSNSVPWVIDNKIRADGGLIDECENYYFIGEIANHVVSLMWYSEKNGAATYGLVSTKEGYRGKGIINLLLQECISFMKQSKTLKAVYLAVSNDIAQRIYEKAGFEIYNGNPECYIMRKVIANDISDFDKYYFAKTDKITADNVKRGDLPLLEALYNYNNGINIKDYTANVGLDTAVECQIIDLINRADTKEGSFMCIRNADENIVGAATIFDDEQGTKVLDFFVHDNYINQAEELLIKIIKQDKMRNEKKIVTHLHDQDKIKRDIITKLRGF